MNIGPLEINPQRIAIFLGIAILLFLILDFNTRTSRTMVEVVPALTHIVKILEFI